jgi:hypothetical protein
MISGEPIPLDKKKQTMQLLQVQLTEINLLMIAEKLVQKPFVVQMVNSASRSRAPIQNWPTE